jgi:NAD(P)-dependent dehydrogenase (short-subunit alcohol dehydrogenase family)
VVSLDAGSLFSLEGRTAVLTGASGFLGRTMGAALLANGARVIAVGRSARTLEVADAWRSEFGDDAVRAERVDMYDRRAYDELLGRLAAEESPGVLVNNAHELGPPTGFNVPEGALPESPPEHWERHLMGGFHWAVQATQRLGIGMVDRGRGSIVNISSMYAEVAPNPQLYEGTGFVNPPGYSAAKAALLAFTRYTASFWGPQGVRANAIVAGPFSNTEEAGPNAVPPDGPFLGRLRARTALGRTGAPHDLAGALLFLASDASAFVTGAALTVDGGWTVT